MRKQLGCGYVGVIAFGTACVSGTPLTTPGSAELGIASFEVTDTAERTTIVGLDAQHGEVARLDFIHGRFTMPVEFGPPYGGSEVDGRSIHAAIRGHVLDWRTVGYTDTSAMPAFPSSESMLTAFLADGHVKPFLDRWQVGWAQPVQAGVASQFLLNQDCEWTGNTYNWCPVGYPSACEITDGTTQGCAGGYVLEGLVLRGSFQDSVSLCCSDGTRAGTSGVFGEKTCSQTGDLTSTCGSGTKCVQCWAFPFSDHCDVTPQWNGAVYNACHDFE
ncbi:MAG TPA: hypothetical protein VFT22_02960 [Kofleriaceae bacterium]|nr:hypothetical protein [Kofleriaceae bacterium]